MLIHILFMFDNYEYLQYIKLFFEMIIHNDLTIRTIWSKNKYFNCIDIFVAQNCDRMI
jgi:hypothetical protein